MKMHKSVTSERIISLVEEDDNMAQDSSLAPDGGPWQDASLWHTTALVAQDAGPVDGAAARTASTE